MTTEPIPEGQWYNKNTQERIRVISYDSVKHTVMIRLIETPDINYSSSKSFPLQDFKNLYEPILANQHFINCLPIRRKTLIENYASFFKDRSTLELGPSTGDFTTVLEKYTQSVTVIENNPHAIKILQKELRENSKIIVGDVHHELWKLPKGKYQIIVCAGLLYHSAHPLFILEGIAALQPELILIDNLESPLKDIAIKLIPEVDINTVNFRYNYHSDCGMALLIGSKVLTSALDRMGYLNFETIDKSHLSIDPDKDSAYFRRWTSSFSAWFHRKDFTP